MTCVTDDEAHLVHPFSPLWVQMTVRFFVLRFENTDDFTLSVPDKVATTGALVYPLREDTFIYRMFCLDGEYFKMLSNGTQRRQTKGNL